MHSFCGNQASDVSNLRAHSQSPQSQQPRGTDKSKPNSPFSKAKLFWDPHWLGQANGYFQILVSDVCNSLIAVCFVSPKNKCVQEINGATLYFALDCYLFLSLNLSLSLVMFLWQYKKKSKKVQASFLKFSLSSDKRNFILLVAVGNLHTDMNALLEHQRCSASWLSTFQEVILTGCQKALSALEKPGM